MSVGSIPSTLEAISTCFINLPIIDDEYIYANSIIEAIRNSSVEHIIYVSGYRTNERSTAPHLAQKYQIEEKIIELGLEYNILKPTFLCKAS